MKRSFSPLGTAVVTAVAGFGLYAAWALAEPPLTPFPSPLGSTSAAPFESSVLDTTYLRLDTTNGPLTGCVTIDSAGNPNSTYCEDGIDRPTAGATTFNIQNSGAGAMTLQVDGTTVCTTAGGAGCTTVPGGANTHVQYNSAGVFGGEDGLTYDYTNNRLSIVAPGFTRPPTTILDIYGSQPYQAHLRISQEASGAGAPHARIELVDQELNELNSYVRGATSLGTFNGLLAKANATSIEGVSSLDKFVLTNPSFGGKMFLGGNGATGTFLVIDAANNVVIGTTGETAGGAVTATAQLELRGHATLPALIVNESGLDSDTHIEGDTDPELVYVDATTDRVGFSTPTPATLVDIDGTCTVNVLNIDTAGTAAAPAVTFVEPGADDTGFYLVAADNLGITAGGVLAVRISTAMSMSVPINDSGYSSTAAVPLIAFDDDTGVYDSGIDEMGISVAGIGQWEFIGTGLMPVADGTEDIGTGAVAVSSVYARAVSGDTGANPLYLSDNAEVTTVINGNQIFKVQNDNIFAKQWTSGAMGYHRMPGGIAAALPTKPTCNSGGAGSIVYMDDTDDTAVGMLCVCRGNADDTTFSWVQVADNTTACI